MNATRSRFLRNSQHLDATDVGHTDVREQQIHPVALQDVDRLRPIGGHRHVVAVAPKHDAQHLPHRWLIVDDEDSRLGGGFGARDRVVRWRCRRLTRHATTLRDSDSAGVALMPAWTGKRTLMIVPTPP